MAYSSKTEKELAALTRRYEDPDGDMTPEEHREERRQIVRRDGKGLIARAVDGDTDAMIRVGLIVVAIIGVLIVLSIVGGIVADGFGGGEFEGGDD